MISVLNHRQPLSGNNLGIWWLVLPLLFSCGASKPLSTVEKLQPTVQEVSESNNFPKSSKSLPKTIANPVIRATDSLLLSVFLPLHASSFSPQQPEPRQMDAIQFYWGIRAAVDSVSRQSGLPARIVVVDTKSDTTNAFRQIESGDNKAAATVLWQNQAVIAWLAQKNNDNYQHQKLIINSGVDAHMTSLMRYFKQNYYVYNALVIQNNSAISKEITAYLQAAAVNLQLDSIKVKSTTTAVASSMIDYLKKGVPNVIFLPITEEQQVANWCKALQPIANEYSITLVGLPNWEKFTNIRSEWFDNLKVTISQSFWCQTNDDYTLRARMAFRAIYQHEPGDEFFRGYDVGRALCQWAFDGKVGSSPLNGIAQPIWIPEWKRKSTVWVNEAVNILRFNALSFEKQPY